VAGSFDAALDQRALGFTIVTALATALGALGAGAAAIVAATQLRDQREIARWASSRDSLWRMSDAWEKLLTTRVQVRAALEDGSFDPQAEQPGAEDLLDFLESLAYLANQKHIDDEMSWVWFYAPAHALWTDLAPYVKRRRDNEAVDWMEIGRWLKRLDEIETKKTEEAKRRPGG